MLPECGFSLIQDLKILEYEGFALCDLCDQGFSHKNNLSNCRDKAGYLGLH